MTKAEYDAGTEVLLRIEFDGGSAVARRNTLAMDDGTDMVCFDVFACAGDWHGQYNAASEAECLRLAQVVASALDGIGAGHPDAGGVAAWAIRQAGI